MVKKYTDNEFLDLAFGEFRKLLIHDIRTTQKQKRILISILKNEQITKKSK